MALSATIYKASLTIADNDRAYYATHAVTVARHPSETNERMMLRLITYALFVTGEGADQLSFSRGLSDADEPELWRRDLTGSIEQWIDLGLPDERRLAKACGRATQVIVVAYGRGVSVWWQGVKNKLSRLRNLSLYCVSPEASQQLATLSERNMQLNINIQDGNIWVGSPQGEAMLDVLPLER